MSKKITAFFVPNKKAKFDDNVVNETPLVPPPPKRCNNAAEERRPLSGDQGGLSFPSACSSTDSRSNSST